MGDEGRKRNPSGYLTLRDWPPEGFRFSPSSLIPHPSSLRDGVMRGLLARHAFRAPVAECRKVEAGHQMLTGAEQHRRYRYVHLVDEPGLQILANGLRTAKEANVLAACCGLSTFQCRVDTVRDEVEDGATFHL